MSLNKLLLLSIAFLSLCQFTKAEEPDHEQFDENLDEMDEGMGENISDIDSTEFVKTLEEHLSKENKETFNHYESVTYLLVVYSESSLEEISALEDKLKGEG